MNFDCIHRRASRWRRFRRRRGQALLEFSLVALVLYLLFAGILTFGQLLYGAQTLQSAADVAAREIARIPLPPASTPYDSSTGAGIRLYDVLYNPAYSSAGSPYAQVRTQVFDPSLLMVQIPQGTNIADLVKTWPIVNQMLYPLMIVNYVNASNNGQNQQEEFLWYPGAVPGTDSNGWPAFRIALVVNRNGTGGAETIEWVPVIEELLQDVPSATVPDNYYGFNVQSQYGGLVSLRINYPYQSATMSAYAQETTSPPVPNGQPLPANDSGVVVLNAGDFTPSTGALTDSVYPTYGGTYGLGSQYAWLTQVRPFRRVVSAQAVARREVFQNPSP
jgi:hypothetical protein